MKNVDNVNIEFSAGNSWGFPDLPAVPAVALPDTWVSWDSRAKCDCYADTGLHFYCDDFQFSGIWTNPGKYVDTINKYKIAVMPDFSLFYDMPIVQQMWNKFRSMWLVRYYDMNGITMIPNINPSRPDCWSWSFAGIPHGSAVAFSAIGSMDSDAEKRILYAGYEEMLKRIEPTQILYFCRKIEECPAECTAIIVKFGGR